MNNSVHENTLIHRTKTDIHLKTYTLPENPLHYKILIKGSWKESKSGVTFTRESPAHGTPVGIYPLCDADDTKEAIKAAGEGWVGAS